MQIEQLNITEYTEKEKYDMGYQVFQVVGEEGDGFVLNFPCPDRGYDAEIDFEDVIMPCTLFSAMMGRKVDPEEIIGKFFRVKLPENVYNV